MALYDEAARWGDYRRDVHPYQTAGQLYTVDDQYMTERDRLINVYFPDRSQRVLEMIVSFVDIDDSEYENGIAQTHVLATPRRNTFYNLQGQRVEQPIHGVYIRNGRKVLIK